MRTFPGSLCVGVAASGCLLFSGCVHYEAKPLAAEYSLGRIEARTLADPGLRRFIEEASGHTPQVWPLTNPTFEEWALVAFYFHPSLDLARAQWEVVTASKKTAAGRPNPTLGVQPGYNLSAAGGVSPWMPGLSVDWPIETGGKRGHRISRARFLAESSRLNIYHTAWQVRGTLRSALLDLTAARRRQDILQRQQDLSEGLLALLEQRFQVGAVSRLEVAPFQLAHLKIASDRADASRLTAEARARVAESLGLPPEAIEGLNPSLDLNIDRASDTGNTPAILRRIALQNRADVRGLLAEYAASEAAVRLEIARQYPDIHLGSGYQWDQGDNKWNLAASLEIPLLNRNQGPIAESLSRRTEVSVRFAGLQSKIIADLDRVLSVQAAARAQVARSEELLERHRRQLDALRLALKEGAADQVELKTAALEAVTAELAFLDAAIRWQQATGELQQILQTPFEGMSLLEQSPNSSDSTSKP